jgi:hypothetical protein
MLNKKMLALIGLVFIAVICIGVFAMAPDKGDLVKVLGGLVTFGAIGMAMGETSILEKSQKSTAAVATAFTICKPGADDDTFDLATGATDQLAGIFQHTTSAAGASVRIATNAGISPLVYGDTVTRGDPLTSDSLGRGITAVAGQNIIGYSTVSGVVGDIGFCALSRQDLVSSLAADGLVFKGLARATFDATAGKAIGSHGLGVTLPDNAIITRSYLEVITTFESATDAGTIALGLPVDDVAGIVAAVAISAATDWDAGLHEGIQTGAAAAFSVKTTAARELTADVAVEALTAGVLVLFCEYVISA